MRKSYATPQSLGKVEKHASLNYVAQEANIVAYLASYFRFDAMCLELCHMQRKEHNNTK